MTTNEITTLAGVLEQVITTARALAQEYDAARVEAERLRRELTWYTGARTAAAVLTPDDPGLPGEPHLLKWDWREQPDLAALAEIVRTMSGGRVHLYPVEETGCDEYALVVSGRELAPDEVTAVADSWSPDGCDGRDECRELYDDPDCGKDLDDEDGDPPAWAG